MTNHERIKDAYALFSAGNHQVAIDLLSNGIDEKLKENAAVAGVMCSATEELGLLILNRGELYARTGNFVSAIEDETAARTYRPWQSAPRIGTLLRLLGQPEEARLEWRNEIMRLRSHVITATDFGGGVMPPLLLWWASVYDRVVDDTKFATRELIGRSKLKSRNKSFDGRLGRYVIDDVSEEEVIEKATATTNQGLSALQLCRVHFFKAGKLLAAGNKPGYTAELEQAVRVPYIYDEYYLAKYYLSLEGLRET